MNKFKLFVVLFAVLISFSCKKIQTYGDKESICGMQVAGLENAAKYAKGSGIVMRGGEKIYSWGNTDQVYDLKSTTKSIGVTVLGLALKDGLLELEDKAVKHYPDFGIRPQSNNSKQVNRITIFNLAAQTAGFDKHGGYASLLFNTGSCWAYSDGSANWLADILTYKYGKDLEELLFERVFTSIGIQYDELFWRKNRYREQRLNGVIRREFGAGIHANVEAMAKIGTLYLNNGIWKGKEILPKTFVEAIRKSCPEVAALPVKNDPGKQYANAPKHYGLLWWNNNDGAMKGVPKDMFFAWGLHDSIIAVIPSLDIVVARAGGTIEGERSPSFYQVIEPFLKKIVASVSNETPYLKSPFISNLIWAPPNSITAKASGSDNWPITWADNGKLYTAYGDGWGFEPKSDRKLSLGFAVVEGSPDDFKGKNIFSPDQQFGQGKSGKKASGLLMVDGVLYMWARNADSNGSGSRLAWSEDHGKNWEWADWQFKEFGYPTFINYGKNYSGARDTYVYAVSHDNPSAYECADHFVLMRVARKKILDRNSYEFFRQFDSNGNPVWTSDITEKGEVDRKSVV